MQTARLFRTVEWIPARDRTACAQVAHHPGPIATILSPERGESPAAVVRRAIAAEFSLCHRVSASRLAPPAVHSSAGKTPYLLGLGRHLAFERAQSRAVRISAAHDRFSLRPSAGRLHDKIRPRWQASASLWQTAVETRSGDGELGFKDRATTFGCSGRLR